MSNPQGDDCFNPRSRVGSDEAGYRSMHAQCQTKKDPEREARIFFQMRWIIEAESRGATSLRQAGNSQENLGFLVISNLAHVIQVNPINNKVKTYEQLSI